MNIPAENLQGPDKDPQEAPREGVEVQLLWTERWQAIREPPRVRRGLEGLGRCRMDDDVIRVAITPDRVECHNDLRLEASDEVRDPGGHFL
jgi:hypothetical protein